MALKLMLAGFWSLICEVRSIIRAGQGGWTAELLLALLVPVANSSGTAETFAPSESSDLLSAAVAVWVLNRFLRSLEMLDLASFRHCFASPCAFFSLLFKEHL